MARVIDIFKVVRLYGIDTVVNNKEGVMVERKLLWQYLQDHTIYKYIKIMSIQGNAQKIKIGNKTYIFFPEKVYRYFVRKLREAEREAG